jgi:hypothetical protein
MHLRCAPDDYVHYSVTQCLLCSHCGEIRESFFDVDKPNLEEM